MSLRTLIVQRGRTEVQEYDVEIRTKIFVN